MLASILVCGAAALLAVPVEAIRMSNHTWFMGGRTLVAEMVDPIVNPNGQSSHQHRVFGGSGFSAAYNYDDYINSQCTSMDVSVDKSVYWVPQLYWVNGGVNNATSYVPLDGGLRIYYNNVRNTPTTPVSPFPKGLRMLVGSPNTKTPNSAYSYYTCQVNVDFSGNKAGTDFNFNQACPLGMKSEITFPSCWNGQSLYNKDGSHVTFPARNQPCPVSHPVAIPAIRLEVTWMPDKWASGAPMNGNLAWANGDTTGYGFHADFVNGWDNDILAAGLNNTDCIGDQLPNPTRFIDCPNFSPYYSQPACSPDKGVLRNTAGNSDWVPISALPGCNKLWGASGSKPTCTPPVPILNVTALQGIDGSLTPDISDAVNYTLPNEDGWHYVGCASINSGFLVDQVSYGASMTLDECQTTCLKAGLLWSGMTPAWDNTAPYTCSCGSDLSDKTPLADGCTAPCPGDSTQFCGANGANPRVSIFYAPPGTLDRVRGLVREGCYQEPFVNSNGLRGLTSWSYQDPANTGQKCLQACINHDSTYTWAATRNGDMCYCGNTFDLGTGFWRGDGACPTACPGNSSETCGGSSSLNVYNLTASTIAAQNMTAIKFVGWQGCFPETSSGFALSGNAFTSALMTPQLCVNGCSELNYTMAAVEQGNLCLCGNSQTATPIQPASSCSRPCAGDANSTCGEYRLFESYTLAGATVSPATIAGRKPPGYIGCYYTPGAAQQTAAYTFTTGSMSVETCAAGCVNLGYQYAMLQGANCRCDNSTSYGPATQSLSLSCSTPCKGNSSETCGASFYTELYDAIANGASVSVANGGYLGCRSDSAGNAVGTSVFSWKTTNLTIGLCTSSCKEIGQPLATVEGGQRCICGPAWPSSGWNTLPDNLCTTPCSGNSSQICGAGSAGSVYDSSVGAPIPPKPTGWLGCYPTSSSVKIISDGATSTDALMTSALCRSQCAARGGVYAALTNNKYCLCGSTLSGAAQVPSSQCTMSCIGNSTDNCGSANFADLYTTKGAAVPNNGIDGYLGCFTDMGNTINLFNSGYMNNQICSLACSGAGYAYAALQPGKCRCTNTAPVLMTTEGVCNVPCSTNSTDMCGSANAGSTYRTSSDIAYPAPSTTFNGVAGYEGCYTQNSMASPLGYSSGDMTPQTCLANCGALGYTYGAVWANKKCSCGSTLTLNATAYRTAESSCNAACVGNTNQMCGGAFSVSLYSVSDAGVPAMSPAAMMDGYQGCFLSGTAITGAGYTYKAGTMVPNLCRRTCRNKGFSVASLSIGNQCSCSNGALYGAPRLASTCATVCLGNSSMTCGYSDTGLVSVFDATGQGALPPQGYPTNYVGCYLASDATSMISYKATGYGKLNSATCASLCAARGQGTYYGTMNANTCTCLSGLPPTLLGDATCSSICAGSAPETCGGGNSYISVYLQGQVASSSIASSSTIAASNTSMIASATTTASNATVTVANATSTVATVSATVTANVSTASLSSNSGTGASTIANGTAAAVPTANSSTTFVNTTVATRTLSTNSTAMSPAAPTSASSTVNSSVATGASSFAINATSTSPSSAAAVNSTVVSSTPSTATGTGTGTGIGSSTDSTRASVAGSSSSSASVAQSSTATATATASATAQATRAVLEGYRYQYCLQDSTARAMNYTYAKNPNLTPQSCMNLCAGFRYFGVESTDTCFCSNALNSNITLPNTDCSLPCTGSPAQLCGGNGAIALYESNTPLSMSSSTFATATATATSTAPAFSSPATSASASVPNNQHLVSTSSSGCAPASTVTEATTVVRYVTVTAGAENGTTTNTAAAHAAKARGLFGFTRKGSLRSRKRLAVINA